MIKPAQSFVGDLFTAGLPFDQITAGSNGPNRICASIRDLVAMVLEAQVLFTVI